MVVTHSSTDENRGDLGILIGMVRGIRASRPEVDITVVSAELCGGSTWSRAQIAETEALGVRVLGTPVPSRSMHGRTPIAWASRLTRSAAALVCARLVGGRARRIAHPDDRPVWDALSTADVVLAKGGSYLYSHGGFRGGMFVWRMLYLLRLSRALGHATVLMGVSVGPVHGRTARRMMRTALATCRRIYVRERLSAAYLDGALGHLDSEIERTADMAFLLDPPHSPPGLAGAEPVIALTIRALPFSHRRTQEAERARLSDVISDTLAELLEADKLLRIMIVVQVVGDMEPSTAIRDRLSRFKDRVTVVEAPGPAQLVSVYQQANVLLATRLHSTIFAALAGTPSVHIVSDTHKGLGISDDLGLRDWCVDADSIEREALTAQITSLMGARAAVSREMFEQIRALRHSAQSALNDGLTLGTGTAE